jgi:hypothetical protein
MPIHVPYGLCGLPSWLWLKCNRLLRLGHPWGMVTFVPVGWMVIYGYGVPAGALNINSTDYPDHGHHGDPPLSGKNPHGRAVNRTRDLMIISQKRWPLDHEAGHPNIVLNILLGWLHIPASKRQSSGHPLTFRNRASYI